MNRLLTVGYEGAAIEDSSATLKALAVGTLVDVRAVPVSPRQLLRKLVTPQSAET